MDLNSELVLEETPNDNNNYWENMSLEEYLLRTRGPKHLPFTVVLPLTVVYAFIFITGVVGNILVCLVIVKNSSMHTATNYYLFSLAVSDVTLLLLGLPNDLSVYWQQYPWELGVELCKLRALVSEMTSYTSVLTIVAFSMERYLAICHPLHSYAMTSLKRAMKIIGVLWCISLACATPFAFFSTVNYIDFPPGSGKTVAESAFCAMLQENLPPYLPIYELSSFLFFLMPLIIIMVLYVRIGLTLRNRNKYELGDTVTGDGDGDSRKPPSKKPIIRMLVAVVVTFFLCWAPFHAQRLLYLYARNASYFLELNEWMYYITGCFYYFSSTINPILYNLMSMKYRIAFKQTLCGGQDQSLLETSSSYRENIRNSPRYRVGEMRRRNGRFIDIELSSQMTGVEIIEIAENQEQLVNKNPEILQNSSPFETVKKLKVKSARMRKEYFFPNRGNRPYNTIIPKVVENPIEEETIDDNIPFMDGELESPPRSTFTDLTQPIEPELPQMDEECRDEETFL